MHCPNCNEPIDEETVFCGNCGKQVAPLYARGATVAEATEKLSEDRRWSGLGPIRADDNLDGQLSERQGVLPRSYAGGGGGSPLTQGQGFSAMPRTPLPSRSNPRSIAFLAIILVLLVVGISAGVVTLLQNKGNTGRNGAATTPNGAAVTGPTGLVSFSDSQNGQGDTDSLRISISGLQAPPQGSRYDAWLVNEQTEQTLPLGTLTPQEQNFALSFTNKGTNLLGVGNKIEVTQEKGAAPLPTGKVLLTAKFPPLAFVHIRHLLFAFPTTPHNIGLLVGLRDQAQLLSAQGLLLKSTSGNRIVTQCIAQSILDIIDGSRAKPLVPACAGVHIAATGDGFGMLGQGGSGYVALVAAHASLAATQRDSTPNIKLHAHHVEIAMDNLKGWLTTIEQDATVLLNDPGNAQKAQEITTLSGHVLNGVDLDDDESVDPVPGEAGTVTAYTHGQLMAALTLAP